MYKSVLLQQLAQKISLCLILGVIGWVLQLLVAASLFKAQTGVASHDITLGPLLLHRLSRQVHDDGYLLTLTFEPGLLWYTAGCLVIGITWAYGYYVIHTRGSSTQ